MTRAELERLISNWQGSSDDLQNLIRQIEATQ